jgi:hypothetical protein
MYFVISVLPISITSGVVAPASVASNFCRWVFHCWYWTSTLHARVLRLECLVRGRPRHRAIGLRVDLKPDGDAVGGRLLRRADVRHDGSRADGGETESDADASLHLEASRVRRACRSLAVRTTAGEGRHRELVRPHATGGCSHNDRTCQYQFRTVV